jgi:RNA polymerase-interacting CarD/CdnL/TRCF family regulator
MFRIGDSVVHLRHGAGVIKETRIIEREGQKRTYVCIELTSNQGTLMIQEEKFDGGDVRPAITDTQFIIRIFKEYPQALQDDHRVRQNEVKDMMKSHDPRKLAEALRDLCWREATDKLTFTDTQMRDKLARQLAQEMSLAPNATYEEARNWLLETLNEAIQEHLAARQAVV